MISGTAISTHSTPLFTQPLYGPIKTNDEQLFPTTLHDVQFFFLFLQTLLIYPDKYEQLKYCNKAMPIKNPVTLTTTKYTCVPAHYYPHQYVPLFDMSSM